MTIPHDPINPPPQTPPALLRGRNERMAEVFELVEAVAPSRVNVLITGESGTGKSLLARAIHARSPRSKAPFVEVACGALPETLLESELFGHVRGAFTHAISDNPGKFAAADGGTLFLDEIATASQQLQVKLLRVLQERQFEPVGSHQTRRVDVRVIFATNRDLWQEVQAGRFRSDLYFRINVINIELPPLRRRGSDIHLLANHFLRQTASDSGRDVVSFSPAALEILGRYRWPGNVRELENLVQRCVVLTRGQVIDLDDLPPLLVAAAEGEAPGRGDGLEMNLTDELARTERRLIVEALRHAAGNRTQAALLLGIDRTTLYKKMKRHDLLGESAARRV